MVIGVLLLATIVAVFGLRRLRRWVRVVTYFALLAAGFGVWEHVEANHDAGPLDFRYATSWPTISSWSQWWKAATKAAGQHTFAKVPVMSTVSRSRSRPPHVHNAR